MHWLRLAEDGPELFGEDFPQAALNDNVRKFIENALEGRTFVALLGIGNNTLPSGLYRVFFPQHLERKKKQY